MCDTPTTTKARTIRNVVQKREIIISDTLWDDSERHRINLIRITNGFFCFQTNWIVVIPELKKIVLTQICANFVRFRIHAQLADTHLFHSLDANNNEPTIQAMVFDTYTCYHHKCTASSALPNNDQHTLPTMVCLRCRRLSWLPATCVGVWTIWWCPHDSPGSPWFVCFVHFCSGSLGGSPPSLFTHLNVFFCSHTFLTRFPRRAIAAARSHQKMCAIVHGVIIGNVLFLFSLNIFRIKPFVWALKSTICMVNNQQTLFFALDRPVFLSLL